MPRVPREHFSPTSHTLRTSFRIVPEEDAVSWSQLIILAVGNYMKKMQKIFFTSCSRNLRNQTMFLALLEYVPCTGKILLLWQVVYHLYIE